MKAVACAPGSPGAGVGAAAIASGSTRISIKRRIGGAATRHRPGRPAGLPQLDKAMVTIPFGLGSLPSNSAAAFA
jgi:hypothetical protein